MNVVIMQPYFLPYVGYFSLLDAADTFVIYDDVNYIKKGWINRNNFLGQTDSNRFTLPIQKASQNSKILDLTVVSLTDSKLNLFKMLSHTYAKAPFYEDAMHVLTNIFDSRANSVVEFLASSLGELCRYLRINVNILRSSEVKLGEGLSGENRIIDISKNLQASQYINAIGGMALYRAAHFEEQGIQLKFLKHKGTCYPQFSRVHVSNLSIVDVIMFNSPHDALNIVKHYELIDG